MPVVPIEENKVGIASLTDAKLRPADFSGSGLDAIGSGLRAVGSAGMDLGKAIGSKPPAPRTDRGAASAKPAGKGAAAQDPAKAGASDNKRPEAEPRPAIKAAAAQQAAPPITLTPTQAANDAAVKRGYCDYVEATRPVLDPEKGAPADRQGVDPAAAARARSDQLVEAYKGIAAGLSPEQHEALHGVMPQRLAQDQALIRSQEAAAAQEAQRQQSQRVVDTSADDAVLHYGTPSFGQSMATGLRQIEEQAALGGWPPEARQAAETRFISGVHRKISESYAGGDVILGAEHLRLFGAHMTSEDRDAAWHALHGPLVQTQAVADADTPWIANAPTAPLTPQGDPALLVQRMLAITPAGPAGNEASGAGDTTDLPALVAQYGGDAAKAWAASAIGADALDALVARHGARWFGAMPKDARNQVAANMAMLGAATAPRRAPTPAERARLAGDIEDQPWSDERKRNAYAELNTRIGLEAKRVKQAQDDAWEKGNAAADQLGAGFISINQLPPAVRIGLAPEALAALMLRADRNVHPVTVPAHGDVAMGLNRMAANDPEAFAKQDLRLYRDQMPPAEYDALDRVQKAWGGYPPGAHGITQQRAVEKIAANGLNLDPPVDPGDAGDDTPADVRLVAPDAADGRDDERSRWDQAVSALEKSGAPQVEAGEDADGPRVVAASANDGAASGGAGQAALNAADRAKRHEQISRKLANDLGIPFEENPPAGPVPVQKPPASRAAAAKPSASGTASKGTSASPAGSVVAPSARSGAAIKRAWPVPYPSPAVHLPAGRSDYLPRRNDVGPNQGHLYADGRYSPEGKYRHGRPHHGDDLPGVIGDPVGSAADGVVFKTGTQHEKVWARDPKTRQRLLKKDKNGKLVPYKVPGPKMAGWGNWIQVRHADGYITRYAHLKTKPNLIDGTAVRLGQQIGVLGTTGNAWNQGSHVHFEVQDVNGKHYDPGEWIAGRLPPAPARRKIARTH
ncbi:hypothetical protein GCM10009087_52160 [Sphingomonas oligophenolica]|uniref:Peptidoglycan DD-metalloendopeptidase family protein n=1 Tax=Sphingomonas oligophenolica TaxID=301154 RepID=A0ABU9Y6W5_9SPHN